MMKVKCNKCGYIGDKSEFPKGNDFFQKAYIKSCPKECGNHQTPGDASLRMMPGVCHPFSYIRPELKDKTALNITLHEASEAS